MQCNKNELLPWYWCCSKAIKIARHCFLTRIPRQTSPTASLSAPPVTSARMDGCCLHFTFLIREGEEAMCNISGLSLVMLTSSASFFNWCLSWEWARYAGMLRHQKSCHYGLDTEVQSATQLESQKKQQSSVTALGFALNPLSCVKPALQFLQDVMSPVSPLIAHKMTYTHTSVHTCVYTNITTVKARKEEILNCHSWASWCYLFACYRLFYVFLQNWSNSYCLPLIIIIYETYF